MALLVQNDLIMDNIIVLQTIFPCLHVIYCRVITIVFIELSVASNLSLHHSQTSSFGIQGCVCEPQACGHMLDEAHGLPILDLWNAHPLHITLLRHIHLLLLRVIKRREGVGGKISTVRNNKHDNRETENSLLDL